MKARYIALLIFILPFTLFAQWKWIHGMPPRQNIIKVQHLSSGDLIAVGEKGLIIKSTNSSQSWFPIESNTNEDFHNLSFMNKNLGWVVGTSGIILKSEDEGKIWSKQNSGVTQNLNSIHFIDEDNGWACGDSGTILYSKDGGENWKTQISGTVKNLKGIHFSNQDTGCCVGSYGALLYTTNGGVIWDSILYSSDYHYASLYFVNNDIGYSTVYGFDILFGILSNIRKTTDGGLTWTTQVFDIPGLLRDIYFSDLTLGFAVGKGYFAPFEWGIIWRTTNGGSWYSIYTTYTTTEEIGFNTVSFNSDASFGITFSKSGHLFSTTDQGENWQIILDDSLYYPFISGCFLNSNEGISISNRYDWSINSWEGMILKSSDSGKSWAEKFVTPSTYFYCIQFLDSIGYIGGQNGILYKTFDYGNNWTLINRNLTIFDVFFLNTNLGWIIDGRDVFKTTDGGESWEFQYHVDMNLNKILFVDEEYGWATIDDYNLGKIVRTTNGGTNWIDMPDLSNNGIKSIFFFNREVGFAGDEGGVLWKTSNGGIDWQSSQIDSNHSLNDIYFTDSLTGFIAASLGTLFKTTTGGQEWFPQDFHTPKDLFSIFFSNKNVGWIFGDGGIILKTSNGGITFIENIDLNKPRDFILYQNYPNPFNPKTTIRFTISDLPAGGQGLRFTTLKIYDVLGREIATIVNEEKPAGNYEVEFQSVVDGRQLASGIYYYQLRAGDYIETKKMVLIK